MTTLPATVQSAVEGALTGIHRQQVQLGAISSVGGGCINSSVRIQTDSGNYFLKWNDHKPADFFATEAAGLATLRQSGELRVPEVVAVADSHSPIGWLLLEFIDRGLGGPTYFEKLGRGLAELHAETAHTEHGGPDNFIGPLAQSNEPSPDWPSFWWGRRLAPQIDKARAGGYLAGTDDDMLALKGRLSELLAEGAQEGCSVLHGDLWSGNVFPDGQRHPVVVDPSVYRGHREVDLAMTELFGGFEREFYDAYTETWPLLPGYEGVRREVYQLYPLLVHLNLFGRGYEAAVREIVGRLIA